MMEKMGGVPRLILLALAVAVIGCRSYSPSEPGPIQKAMSGGSFEQGVYASQRDFEARYDQVRKLLEEGADPNEKINSKPGTVLGRAVEQKDFRMAELLLKHGADPYNVGPYFESPIQLAAEQGNEELVRLLLKHGGPPKNKQGEIPLVAYAANVEVAKRLMPPKKAIARRGRYGLSVLSHPVSKDRYDVVKLLLESGAAEVLKTPGSEVATDNPEILRLLLKYGADPNKGWQGIRLYGENALMYAVIQSAVKRSYDTLPILLEHGADPDVQGTFGWTALHRAAIHGDVEIARILLDGKAKVDSRDEIGRTPLHLAVIGDQPLDRSDEREVRGARGSLPMVRYLLLEGAPVNAEDDRGQTPLFRAATADNRPVVRLLLERGADPEHRDKQGRTVASVAGELGRDEVMKMLEVAP